MIIYSFTHENFVDAFKKWDLHYRENKDRFLSEDECNEMDIDELANLKTDHFVKLLQEVTDSED